MTLGSWPIAHSILGIGKNVSLFHSSMSMSINLWLLDSFFKFSIIKLFSLHEVFVESREVQRDGLDTKEINMSTLT